MVDFSISLNKFIKKAGANADKVIGKVVLDIGAELVLMSPVGDPSQWKGKAPEGYVGGRFRANWSHSIGGYSTHTFDTTSAGASMQRIKGSLPRKAAGLVHYVTNSLPYAMRLEEGWSDQAPFGMVELTRIKFQRFINDAVKEVNP